MKYSLRTLMIAAMGLPPLLAGATYLVFSFGGFAAFVGILYAGICLVIVGYCFRQLIRLTRP